jgi:hypothetical protein
MRPGLALIQATGSDPTSTHVPTSNCSMNSLGVLAARTSMGRLPSSTLEFVLVIVIAGAQTHGFELLGSRGECAGEVLPAIDSGHASRRSPSR